MTKQEFDKLPPGKIFAKGVTTNAPGGLNMTGEGETIFWVATKGGNNDWCIYTHISSCDFGWIKKYGDKVHDKTNIQNVFSCDEEMFKRYRH